MTSQKTAEALEQLVFKDEDDFRQQMTQIIRKFNASGVMTKGKQFILDLHSKGCYCMVCFYDFNATPRQHYTKEELEM